MAGNEKLLPGEIYAAAVDSLPAEDIDHHASDLYLRCSRASAELLGRLENKKLISVFPDSSGELWFELPFCFTPYWENPSKYY